MPALTPRPQSPATIDSIASEADVWSAQLKGCAKALRDLGVESIQVNGYTSLVKGVSGMRAFCNYVQAAIMSMQFTDQLFAEPDGSVPVKAQKKRAGKK